MKNLAALSFIICLLAAFGACKSDSTNQTATNTQPANQAKTANQNNKPVATSNKDNAQRQKQAAGATGGGKINWITVDELPKKMKEQPRKVVVDLYTNWCGWCKRMDKATFQHPQVAEYVNDNFYAIKFNAEVKDPINFKGKDYKFIPRGRKGTNELAFEWGKNGSRMSYPTISFLDENMDRINAFPGFKTPDQFDAMLHYIKDDAYKSQTVTQFAQNFKSEIPPTAVPGRGGNKNRNARVKPNKQTQKNLQEVLRKKSLQQKSN